MTPRVILRPAVVPRVTEAGAAAVTAAFDDFELLPPAFPRPAAGAAELAQRRAAEFRSASRANHFVSVHNLCSHDDAATRRLFADAADGARALQVSSFSPTRGGEHGSEAAVLL